MSNSTNTWGETIATNPATGEQIGAVPNTDLDRFAEMMTRARVAQAAWASMTFNERAQRILAMRSYIVTHMDELATVVSRSNGKTRVDAMATEVLPCALACDWYAKHTAGILRERRRSVSSILFFQKRNSLLRLPIGVVGIISPWNYPLSIPFGEVVMGLMAGNAVMLKVAAATPLVGEAIEQITAAADLPPGLFQLVTGSGGQVSRAFLSHGIDKIFFTGSVGVGKELMAAAAETLTPLSLELGGNDPMIVLEDADLERAANGALWAGFQNCGQSCGGVERIYVHESVYEEFVRLMTAKTKALRHGPDNGDFAVDIGSITTAGQLRTVQGHLEDALARGGRIAAQSQGPAAGEGGLFHPATLLLDVPDDALTMREETFGPLVPITAFRTEGANDSDLALTSSVWTRDTARGKRIARRLQTGVTTINDHLYTHGLSEMPWGGWKYSGLGRTHGPEGLHEMTHLKAINWDLMPGKRNLWWYPQGVDAYAALKQAAQFVFAPTIVGRAWNGIKLTPFLLGRMLRGWKV